MFDGHTAPLLVPPLLDGDVKREFELDETEDRVWSANMRLNLVLAFR